MTPDCRLSGLRGPVQDGRQVTVTPPSHDIDAWFDRYIDPPRDLTVNSFKVDFDLLDWQQGRPGVRFKVYCHGSRQLRLVEFETTDGDPHWCEQGHIGYVLKGGVEIEVNGRVDSLIAGDGLFIPAGAATSHRGVRIMQGTRLLMVEDL